MEIRNKSRRIEEIAETVLNSYPELAYIRDSEVTITYLVSDAAKVSKGKTIYAQCEKTPAKYKWAIDSEFCIVVYQPNCERLTADQLQILLFHELLHIGVNRQEDMFEGEKETYYIVPHDIEEFKIINEKFGLEWSN